MTGRLLKVKHRDGQTGFPFAHTLYIKMEKQVPKTCREISTNYRAPWPTRRGETINRLTPNESYMGRTAPLTSKHCVLYIYSTNIGTEYFKHALYSPFFSLENAVCFITLTCLVPVLFTFYIQDVLKLKKK